MGCHFCVRASSSGSPVRLPLGGELGDDVSFLAVSMFGLCLCLAGFVGIVCLAICVAPVVVVQEGASPPHCLPPVRLSRHGVRYQF